MSQTPIHPGTITEEFGKWLVAYVAAQDGYEVFETDNPAVQLVAEKAGQKYAIHVNARRISLKENTGVLVSPKEIEDLRQFTERSATTGFFAHVLIVPRDNLIHLVTYAAADVPSVLKKVKGGYRKDIKELTNHPAAEYCCWKQQGDLPKIVMAGRDR